MHMFATSPFPQSKVTHLSSQLSDKMSNEECLKYIIKMSLHHAPALAAYLTFDITSDEKGHVVTIGAVPIRFTIEVTAESIIEALLAKKTELPLPSFEETHRSLLLKLNATKEQLNQVRRLEINKQKADLTLKLAELCLLTEVTETDTRRHAAITQEIEETDKKMKESGKSDTKQYTITLADIILRARKHLEELNKPSLAEALGTYLNTSQLMELDLVEFRKRETLLISQIHQAYLTQAIGDEISGSNQFNQLLYAQYKAFHEYPTIENTGEDFIGYFMTLEPVTFNSLDEVIVYNLFNGHMPQLLTLRILSFIDEIHKTTLLTYHRYNLGQLNILTKNILSLFIGLLHDGSGDAIPHGGALESSRAYISSKPNSGLNTIFNQSAFLTAIQSINQTLSVRSDILTACNAAYKEKGQGIFARVTGLTRASETTRTDTFCMVTDDTGDSIDIYTLFLCQLSNTAKPSELDPMLQAVAAPHRQAWLNNIKDISASLQRRELSALHSMTAADVLNSTLGRVLDGLLQSSAEEAANLTQDIVSLENSHSALTTSVAKKSLATSQALIESNAAIARFTHTSRVDQEKIDALEKRVAELTKQSQLYIAEIETARSAILAFEADRVDVCNSLSTLEVKSALEALPGGEDTLGLLRDTKFFDDELLESPLSP